MEKILYFYVVPINRQTVKSKIVKPEARGQE
jgi:hypothetical protein